MLFNSHFDTDSFDTRPGPIPLASLGLEALQFRHGAVCGGVCVHPVEHGVGGTRWVL
jgi:hypothetical protein